MSRANGHDARPCLLVDLDGTLIDPAPGIIAGCREALTAMGVAVPPPDALRFVIGPPLRESFALLLGAPDRVEDCVAAFRRYYGVTGLFEAALYPGTAEALSGLQEGGYRLLLCTAKVRPFAERILDHFDIARYFDGVYGSEFNGRFDDKGELIGHMQPIEGFTAAETLMIGDRRHDVTAAARHGIPTIGAVWGYGGEAELTAAGAAALCAAPADLMGAVQKLFGAACKEGLT